VLLGIVYVEKWKEKEYLPAILALMREPRHSVPEGMLLSLKLARIANEVAEVARLPQSAALAAAVQASPVNSIGLEKRSLTWAVPLPEHSDLLPMPKSVEANENLVAAVSVLEPERVVDSAEDLARAARTDC